MMNPGGPRALTTGGAVRSDTLIVPAGDGWTWYWPLFEGDFKGDQDPANVDGWTAQAQVRRSIHSPHVLFSWSTAPGPGQGRAVIADSRLTLLLTPAESATWRFTQGTYKVGAVDPDGVPTTVSAGRLVVAGFGMGAVA